MIYFIGGPAREGKSTLAKRFRKEISGQILSGDALTKGLQEVLSPDWVPDIFANTVDAVRDQPTPKAKLARVRRRDEAMWPFFRSYITSATHDSRDDILLEGDVWPDLVASFELEHRAIFLIDTSPAQAERLIAIRDGEDNDNNWMNTHGYSDAIIHEWAKFNALRSQRYRDLCLEHGYAYFDIAEGGIHKAASNAFVYLREEKEAV